MIPILLAAASMLAAQEPAPAAQDLKLSTEVDLVVLDLAVRDAKGAFVAGLGKQNFQVFENGKPQAITLFGKQDEPVTIGLVVDNSGSMQTKRLDVVTAALAFVHSSNPQDEVFVVTFNDNVTLGLPGGVAFSSDTEQLRGALTTRPPAGRTALYDAVELALDHAALGHQDRKTLVVISDGGDNASFRTFEDVQRKARQSNVTIYTVGIWSEDDPDRNPAVLRRLARETGGEMFQIDKLSRVRGVCESIASEIRGRYVLGFVPAPEGPALRNVRVAAVAPGRGKLHVRTRASFLMPERRAAR